MRDVFDLPLGPVFGRAGTVTTISVQPQCRYKVMRVMAQDTGNPVGTASRVMQVLVGNRLQRPTASGGTLVTFFGPPSLGGRLGWDTCDLGLRISLTVSFIQDCTVDVALFGYATI